MSCSKHVVNIVERDSSGLPVLNADKLKNLLVNTQASKIPVAFYSICGSARSGKSFAWNLFVRYLKSQRLFLTNTESDEYLEKFFEWKGGDERHTDGILVYKHPFYFKTSKHEKIALFLMDTQGMFDSTESGKNSGMIFTLSFLISSLQVFNVNKQLEATHLQYSYKAMRILETIRKCKPGTKPIQTLIFLIRDWRRKKSYSLGMDGGNKYVKNFMRTSSSQADDQRDVRKELESNFEKVSGGLLPEPGDKIMDLPETANNCQIKDVKRVFYETAEKFFRHLCDKDNIALKTVDGEVLNGEELYTYIVQCGAIVAKFPGLMEPFGTFVEHDYRAEMRKVTCNALSSYILGFCKEFQSNRNRMHIQQRYEDLKNTAFEEFDQSPKPGGKELHGRWKEILNVLMEKNYRKFKDCVHSEEVFASALNDYENVLRSNPENFKDGVNRIIHPKNEAKRRSNVALMEAAKKIKTKIQDSFIAKQCYFELKRRAGILLDQHLMRIERNITGVVVGLSSLALGGVIGAAVPAIMSLVGASEVTTGLIVNTAIAGSVIGLTAGVGTYALINYSSPLEQVIRMSWAEGGDDLNCIEAEIGVALSYGVVRFRLETDPSLIDERKFEEDIRTFVGNYKEMMEKQLKDPNISDSGIDDLHEKTKSSIIRKFSESVTKSGSDVTSLDPLKEQLKSAIEMEYICIKPEKQANYFSPKDIMGITGDDGFLGRGGFGCVRLGYHDVLGFVAVKCFALCGSKLEIEEKQNKFWEEIELLRLANHTQVVRVEGYTTWQGAIGMMMEYLPGGSLSSLLFVKTNDGKHHVSKIHPAIRLQFCYDITHGMTYLHHGFNDQRMTHGDLKPHNILLTAELRCKIADFGGADFATCSEYASPKKNKSKTHHTPAYDAPERPTSPRTTKAMDVFSVGMIFQGVLVRKRPMVKEDEEKRAIKNIKQTYKDQDNHGIIDAIEKKMASSRSKDPGNRPRMKEIRDDFQALFFTLNRSEISRHAHNIIKSMKIEMPSTSSPRRSIDNFAPPAFKA